MSWVTLLWSMDAAFCFTLAGIYLLVWSKQRDRWEYLLFACSCVAAGVFTGFELTMMRAQTPAQFGALLRWVHVPIWALVLSSLWFVHLYLRAGRRWLVWTISGLRTLTLILNFIFTPNINYRQIAGLRHLSWWGGETISAPVGVPNPWTLLTQLTLLLLLIFFVDATIIVWRRGNRRRALVVGGSAIIAATLSVGLSVLIIWGVIQTPLVNSFAYLFMIAAMGYELSRNLLQAAQLAEHLRVSEAALRESEARMHLAANAANLGLWVWNIPGGEERWVTEKWRQLFGFADSEPVTFDRFLEVVHPGDSERVKQVVQQILEHGGEYEIDYRITRPDGSIRWIATRGSVELDERGKPVLARGVSRDVTKRKIAEEELRESEARFRTVANAAPVMIWMSGPDKLCTFFNKGWLDFTGRSLEQELGNGWAEGVHREDIDRCLDVYQNSFNARESFTMEYRLRRSDGEYRWLLDSGTPRFASDGAFLGYIGSCIDITERKAAEVEARQLREQVELLGRVSLLGEMAASLAHELDQPLAAILSNATAAMQYLEQGKLDPEQLQEILTDVVGDGRRAHDIMHNVRSAIKKGSAIRGRINLNDVVKAVTHMVHLDAAAHFCKVEMSLARNLPAIDGDPSQIQQVLINLVRNAFDAMRDTPLSDRKVEIATTYNGDGTICVAVRDYGSGIPEPTLERLFEQFFTTKEEGLGMGLAIVRSIVEAHGGSIAAENADGGGARFRFRLPTKDGMPQL